MWDKISETMLLRLWVTLWFNFLLGYLNPVTEPSKAGKSVATARQPVQALQAKGRLPATLGATPARPPVGEPAGWGRGHRGAIHRSQVERWVPRLVSPWAPWMGRALPLACV